MNRILFLLPLLLVITIPTAFAQVVDTQGENYDLIENFNIGEATWQSHPDRIMDGQWENYVLTNTNDKVIFNTNAVGSFIFDKNSCSYSIYENGYDGANIIPSVSAMASFQSNGVWSNLPVNDEACTVEVREYEDGVFLTSSKVITETVSEDVFITYTGTTENFYGNGTNSAFTLLQSTNGTNTGYFNGEVTITEGAIVESFVQELRLDINSGFKETFKVIHDGDEPLGISQTVHTGESITIGDTTINIAELNGQSFDRQYIIDNQAEILQLTDSVNYDFDTGIKSLTNVNIIFDGDYKVNLDYANGNDGVPFVGYLEIDPTFGYTGANTEYRMKSALSTGSTCVTTSVQAHTVGWSELQKVSTTLGSQPCETMVAFWDVSSITSGASITNVNLRYDQTALGSNELNCSVYPMTYDSSATDDQIFADSFDGTKYVTNDSGCTTVGNDKVIDLGTQADTDISLVVGTVNEFGIGFGYDNMVRDSNTHYQYVANPELEVTYTISIAPQPPTGLSTTVGIPLGTSWTSPEQTVTTDYKVHTFTTTGASTFQVTAGSGDIEYLVVAGGAGGGTHLAGGGGAGGLLTATGYGVTAQSYGVTVGTGGAGGSSSSPYNAVNGADSVFDSITAIGGGYGAGNNAGGGAGGSGGGSARQGAGGTGVSGQGYAGGTGGSTFNSGSGGGGSGGLGGNHVSSALGGDGGIGTASSISGTSVYYAGGGGGGQGATSTSMGGSGGSGVGGNGAMSSSISATVGVANTGSGGGGGGWDGQSNQLGSAGGSGIVIIRYLDDGSITATGGTVTSITASQSNGGNGGSAITGYKVYRSDSVFTQVELPNSSGSDSELTFTDNEFLLHGFETTPINTAPLYQIHTFTSDDTFTVTGSGTVEYLVVGGGGGGGARIGGGGGGGGLLTGTTSVTAQSYSILVGDGGAGGNGITTSGSATNGGNGGDSTFSSITSIGGGGGGTYQTAQATNGNSGGSGGGGGGNAGGSGGGSGTSGQGNSGGDGASGASTAGGGGGAGSSGGAGTVTSMGGSGGSGSSNSITGTAIYYAGGGGGSSDSGQVSGGSGGGGNGGSNDDLYPATVGTDGLGGGGGGDRRDNKYGGAGGSGIVIIKYLTSSGITATGGDTVTSLSDKSTNSVAVELTIGETATPQSGWTTSNSAYTSANADNSISFDLGYDGGTREKIAYDTGSALSDTWVVQYRDLQYSSIVESDQAWHAFEVSACDEGSGWGTNCDSTHFTNYYDAGTMGTQLYTNDNTANPSGTSGQNISTTTSGTYCIELTRVGDTFTASNYDNGSCTGTPVTSHTDTQTGVTGLQYINVMNRDNLSRSGSLIGTVGSVVYHDGNNEFQPITQSTTGSIGTALQNPNLSYTDSNLPDNTDVLSVGGYVKLDSSVISSDVTWDSATIDTFTLSNSDKTATTVQNGGAWQAKVQSTQTWTPSDNPTVKFSNSGLTGGGGNTQYLIFGLDSNPYAGTTPSGNEERDNCDFCWGAMYIGVSTIGVKEGATTVYNTGGSWTTADIFGVEIESDGTVNYLKNDVIVYTSTQTASGTYYAKGIGATEPSTGASLEATYTQVSAPANTKLLGLNDVTFNVGATSASVDETITTSTTTSNVVTDTGCVDWNYATQSGSHSNASGCGIYTASGAIVSNAIESVNVCDSQEGCLIEWTGSYGGAYYEQYVGLNKVGSTQWVSGNARDTLDYGVHFGWTGNAYALTSTSDTSVTTGSILGYYGGTWKIEVNQATNQVEIFNGGTKVYTYPTSDSPSGEYRYQLGAHWSSLNTASQVSKNVVSSTVVTVADVPLISATGLTDNTSTPQHYAFTRDSSNGWAIYQNGVSQATATDATSLGTNVGNNYSTNISGSLDEFFINSDLLSSTEIAGIADRGATLTPLTTTTATTYDDSTVVGGNTYYYAIKAENAVGLSDYTTFVSGLAGSPPDAPTSVSTAINAPNSAPLDVTVSWSAPTNVGTGTLSGFEVYRDGVLITTTGLVTSYTDTVPSGGGTFIYSLKALSNHGSSVLSTTSSITTATVPPTPTATPTLAINNPNPSPFDVDVSWTAQSSGGSTITGYEIFRSADDITFTSVGTVTDLDFTDTVATEGTWYYTFASTNLVGASGQSPSSSITTATVPSSDSTTTLVILNPNPSPLDITVSLVSPSSNGGSSVTGYNIFSSPDDVTYTQVSTGVNTAQTITVANAGTWYFKSQAINNVGTATSQGGAVSIATPTVPPTPTVPTSVIPNIDTAPYTVTVTWGLPATTGGSDLTGYNLYRQTGTGAFSLITTTTALSYIDTLPTAQNQPYTYKIHALNNVGESTAFASTTITTGGVPSAPVMSVTSGTTILSWTAPSSDGTITGYKVYRDTVLLTTVTTLTHSDFTTISFGSSYDYTVVATSSFGDSVLSNSVTTTPETEITGMIAQGVTGTGAVINWEEPAYYQGQVTSYNVYYQTPSITTGTPNTNAGTTTNTYSNFAPQLEYNTSYTFGVSINSPLGNSGLSNLVTVTTSIDGSIVAFDPTTGGMEWFDIDSVNDKKLNVIEFQRETQMINSTATDTLQVAYPSWWDSMTCNVDYKFAQKTEQYVEGTDMTAQVNSADANQQIIGFSFQDINNEVVTVECAPQQTDEDDASSGKYVMTQNNLGVLQSDGTYSVGTPSIPLVAQISNFSNGSYGTGGDFGALNIVGLFAIMISMVGFNRLSPIVGVLLSASLIFVLAWFGIVTIPVVIVGVIALVIFLAWGINRNR